MFLKHLSQTHKTTEPALCVVILELIPISELLSFFSDTNTTVD